MKKQLKAELKKLAQEILQSENFSSEEMQQRAKALYEKLTILNFVERNLSADFSETKQEQPKQVKAEAKKEPEMIPSEEMLFSAEAIRRSNYKPEYEQHEDADEIIEPNTEKMKRIVSQMPEEIPAPPVKEPEPLPEMPEPEKPVEEPKTEEQNQHSFDIDMDYLQMPEFEPKKQEKSEEKPQQQPEKPTPPTNSYASQKQEPQKSTPQPITSSTSQPTSLNNKLRRGINIGLNDRIAFIKHLFDGSAADYNRVLSQINTFNSQEEAYDFIAQVVKPDYNNWEGKEVYEARFLDIIDGKFN